MRRVTFILMALILMSCNDTTKEPEITTTNADRVKLLYDAFAIGDVDAVLAGFTEDINWNEAENFIYADGNPYIGKTAVVEGVFARLGAEWEYWNLENKQFMNVGDNMVLVTGRYVAKNKATAKELNSQFAHVWTLKDTLASTFQQYTDTKQAAEAIVLDQEE